MEKPFVHLHNHTAYSLLDGAGKLDDMIERALALGMPALAITDHGVMYGVVDFYKACQKKGLKPIIGCEVYVAPHSRFDKQAGVDDSPYHLVLLVENETGYHNLAKLVTESSLNGFYYKPRIDRELLQQHHEGLIALSGCMAGEVAQDILNNRLEEAREAVAWYRDLFGPDHYYLEIQNQGIYEQVKLNSVIAQLGQEFGVPLAATNDNHYVYQEDAKTQDVMMCIQMGKTLEDTNRLKFDSDQFYLKSYQEMHQALGEYPEALDNTVKIAEMCHFDFEFGHNHMPDFDIPAGETLEGYLEKICREGLIERYGEPTQEAQERLRYELGVIHQMGYDGYFLIVWDFIRYAREHDIYVGPGRGSAAGSIVSYVLRITDIDPLKYDLLFERFLNPERVSMPDIDIDFCYERRGEVIDYVVRKYGQDKVCQIITFGTMAAKGAIRDVGRVMNVPLSIVNKVAKMVPNELNITLQKAIKMSSELRQAMADDAQIRELIETAQKLEGLPRHAGTHAAGVVISQRQLSYYLPLQKTNDGNIITQYAKENVEEIGLLKMDFLGLRTLTVINQTVDLIRDNRGIVIDFDQIDLNDPASYELLCQGESIGIFQMESSGLRNILKELQPTSLEEIIALVALYRPGPLSGGMVEDFIERKHGRKEIEYLHPSLEPILQPTYGVILYQEQVMRIASVLSGFTLGEADLLRRAMGKKKPEIIAGMKQQFIEGATKNGIDTQTSTRIFELIEYFAGYGFNKSHSAAYAVVAFQTAYLKAHFPTEFMAALLTSVMDSTDRVPFYIEECHRMNIKVLPPDINESGENFQVAGPDIRFGLAAVKGVGKGPIQSIIEARREKPFTSLQDFCARVDLSLLNKRVLENLIKSGAFSSVPGSRAQLLRILDKCIEQGHEVQKDKHSSQISLFDFAEVTGLSREFADIPLPDIAEFALREILSMEKEILGLYVSGHPLDEYRELLAQRATHRIDHLTEEQDQERLKLGGIITRTKISSTKKGEIMAYCTLEDLSGSIEVLVFPRVLEQFRSLVQAENVVLMSGRLNAQEDTMKLFAEEIALLTPDEAPAEPAAAAAPDMLAAPVIAPPQEDALERAKNAPQKLYLRLEGDNAAEWVKEQIKVVLARYPGPYPVYLFKPETREKSWLAHYWVADSTELLQELAVLIGITNIKFE